MELIIEQMFLRCFRDSCFEQAIGEAERDKVEREEKKDREIEVEREEKKDREIEVEREEG
jgi:hypothetical protein